MKGPYSTRELYKEEKGGEGKGGPAHAYPVAGELIGEEGKEPTAGLSLGGCLTWGLSLFIPKEGLYHSCLGLLVSRLDSVGSRWRTRGG